MDEYIMKEKNSAVWDGKYYCANQYKYTLAVYFMSIVHLKIRVSAQISIGALGHGQYVVDNLNKIGRGIRGGN